MTTFLNTKHRIFTLSEHSVPVTPLNNYGSIYLSSITGDLSIVKSTGAVIDLEDHNALSNYVVNEHVDHTSVLLQGATNSGLNIDSGTAAIDLTAGTKQISMNINNLATASAIDPVTDLIALYDSSNSLTVNDTIQNVLNSGIVSSLDTILTTKGDILTRNTTETSKLPIGLDNQILIADSSEETGLKWVPPELNYDSVESLVTTSTSANTYQVINGMQITPASGTYTVTFSTTMEPDVSNIIVEFAIFVDGVIQQVSHRFHKPRRGNSQLSVHTQLVATVNGSQTVDVRWVVDRQSVTCYERSMFLLKLR